MFSKRILVKVATPARVRDSESLLVEVTIVNTLRENLILEKIRIKGKKVLQEVVFRQDIRGLGCSILEGRKILVEESHNGANVFRDLIVVPRTEDVYISFIFGGNIERVVRLEQNVTSIKEIEGWYRADGHVHSDYSGDSSSGLEVQVEAGWQNGLGVLIFTDHGDHFDPEHPRLYNGKGSWLDQREAILGSLWPMSVGQGLEVTTNPKLSVLAQGNTHVLCWNMRESFSNPYASPFGSEKEVVDGLMRVNPGCLVGAPHPGLPVYGWKSLNGIGIQMVEVFSVLRGLDGVALDMWDRYNQEYHQGIVSGDYEPLVAVGNSDAHWPAAVGRYSNWFRGEPTEEGFYQAIRSREVVAVNGLSWANGTLNGYPMGSVIPEHSKYVIELQTVAEEGFQVDEVVLVSYEKGSKTVVKKPDVRFEVSRNFDFVRVMVSFRRGNGYTWAVLQPWFF